MDGGDRWNLQFHIRRVLGRLAAHIERQRRRGRGPATDALAGFAIEEGEAEGLVAELAADPPPPGEQAPAGDLPPLSEIDGSEGPLARAVLAFELAPLELDALVLALAVELDARFARLVAFVNDHAGRTRPTVGLALAIADSPPPAVELLDRPFLRDGLLELEGDGPLSGLALRVHRDLLVRLGTGRPVDHNGRPGPAEPGREDAPAAHRFGDVLDSGMPGVRVHHVDEAHLDRLILPAAARERLERWGAAVGAGRAVPPLLVAGPSGVGRATAARAAFAAAGLPTVEADVAGAASALADRLRAARREARWHAAGIVVRAGETGDLDVVALWNELARGDVPIAIVAPQQAVHALAATARSEPLVVELRPPDLQDRALLWRAFCGGEELSDREVDELAARFEFTPRSISRAVRRARAQRDLSPNGHALGAAELHAACRELGSAGIGPIAQRMPLPYARSDLVVPERLLIELDLAVAWVRHRRRVMGEWGFARRVHMGRGLAALFAGPPGTGKTMAAQVLARDLGLDLYRVDLSRVMSKYIGETEKNLSRLFDEAQASGAVLFFDEADALFGKRSEVRDAHDRYANVEIGYLLQRMEEHEGAAILATNRMGDLDEAFRRRLHFILDFPMPNREDRLRIWEGMFPREVERAGELELQVLADAYELSGGEIRNCVLSAAYMAAREGLPVGIKHVRSGLRRELLKSGRVIGDEVAL